MSTGDELPRLLNMPSSCPASEIDIQISSEPISDAGGLSNTAEEIQTGLSRTYHKAPKPSVNMDIYPPTGYIRDNSLLSWMNALPTPPTPKSYSWSNEGTIMFILTLCEARRAGLITPSRLEVSNRQGRIRIWDYIRQRFCESGLYALVPGLTNAVLEAKYKAEQDNVFKPYKKLVGFKYSGTGFDMDAAGQFSAPAALWERHFAMKGNKKDVWLQQRGMPLWAQYEEAFGEDVATGHVAQITKQRQRQQGMTQLARSLNDIDFSVGPKHNVILRREQSIQTSTAPQSETDVSSLSSSRMELARPNKRRKETHMITTEIHDRMAATLQQVSKNTLEKLSTLLNKHDENQMAAYRAVKALGLGNEIEKRIQKALEVNFNVADVLDFSTKQDTDGLRTWCLEMANST